MKKYQITNLARFDVTDEFWLLDVAVWRPPSNKTCCSSSWDKSLPNSVKLTSEVLQLEK